MSAFESSFRGKPVLVTGAGRGIGRALVVELHKIGAKVYALSKSPDNLSGLKEECPGITPLLVDLVDWEATRTTVSGIDEPISYLVNNAAIYERCPFMDITPEEFDAVMAVNVKAVINVSQVVARKLIDSGKPGSIVNISSIGGLKAFEGCGMYGGSKATLEMVSKVMALELGKHKIRVNCVNPAGVDTDMLHRVNKHLSPEDKKKAIEGWAEQSPLGKSMMPMDEVVNTILFMLSDLGGQITGQSLAIDGGILLS